MKILDRYIAFTLIKSTLLALFSLVLLLSLFTLIEELDKTGQQDYDTWRAMYYTLLTMPRLAFELFPVTAVIGSMTTLGLFARNNELAVMRTSGVSQARLACSLCKGVVFLIGVSLFIGEVAAPYSEQAAKHMRSLAMSKEISLKTQHGFWVKNGQSFINIRKVLPGHRMEGIQIYEFDDTHKLQNSIATQWGEYQNGQWLLKNIERTEFTEQGIKIRRITSSDWQFSLDPELISSMSVKPKFLPFIDLYRYIIYLKNNAQNSAVYERALWSKIIQPLFIVIMVLIAIPIVQDYTATKAIGLRVFIGCLVGVVFHIINQVLDYAGIIYSVHPTISIALPNLLALMTIAWLIRKST